jgi:peptidoglycan-N-acetylglucosamine deacetylase
VSNTRKTSTVNLFGLEIQVSVRKNKRKKTLSSNFPFLLIVKYSFLYLIILVLFSFFMQIKNNYIVPVYTAEINPFSTENYLSLVSKPKIVKKQQSQEDNIVFNGPRDKRRIALTFDADMTPQMKRDLETGVVISYFDRELINILNETGTKSTLFLSGLWIESYIDDVRELSQNPLFELANHAYSHPGFDGNCFGLIPVDQKEKYNELNKTQELLRSLTGQENRLFRFPGGCYSKEDLALLKSNNLLAVQWDASGQDGFNNNISSIISNVLNSVRNGSIIVLHMNGYPNEPMTAQALPFIIASLRQQGFEFVTVSELLTDEKTEEANLIKIVSSTLQPN